MLFINKTLQFSNIKTGTGMTEKISVFVICVDAIIYFFYVICMTVPLILYNAHTFWGTTSTIQVNGAHHHFFLQIPILYLAIIAIDNEVGHKNWFLVASSPKLGLGENVVLQLIECLPETGSYHIFMDNYFTPFRQPIQLGVKKYRLSMSTITGNKQL